MTRPCRPPRVRTTALSVAVAVLLAVVLAGCGAASPTETAAPAADKTAAAASPGAAASSPDASVPSPDASVAAATAEASPSPTPTPEPPLDKPTKKHPMKVYFGGDSLSGMPGMWLGILRQKDKLAKVKADYVESSRLTADFPVDWPSRLKQQMADGHYDVGVFMIGANDSGMPMLVGGKSVMYPKKAWLDEYESRAKKIAQIMLRAGVERVYWVGMPIMPSSTESKKMRDLNKVFEEVAAGSPDIEYVDSYDLLSTKSGKIDTSLRSGDGVHYTDEGAQTVAKAVWKAIREDWGGR